MTVLSEWMQRLVVRPAGWTIGHVELAGLPCPRKPIDGLIGPDGGAWEAFQIDGFGSGRRVMNKMETVFKVHELAGYEQVLVEIDGKWWRGERLSEASVLPFGGLMSAGEWRDHSCGGAPWQWTMPVVSRGQKMYLHLRCRWSGPWHGYVVICGPNTSMGNIFRAKWSPDLLDGMKIPEDDDECAKQEMFRAADAWLQQLTRAERLAYKGDVG